MYQVNYKLVVVYVLVITFQASLFAPTHLLETVARWVRIPALFQSISLSYSQSQEQMDRG